MDRDKLILERKKLIKRMDDANTWLENSIYNDWEEVKEEKYKFWHEWENLIKESEWLEEEMIKLGIIKRNIEGFELVKANN